MIVPRIFRGRASYGLALILAWCAVSVPQLLLSQEVQITVSSDAGDRLSVKPPAHFQAGARPQGQSQSQTFEIRDEVRYQTMDGFGASFLEAGLICINDLPPAEQEAVLRALFDPKSGAGFSAMKTVLASTDFMSAGPFYSYDPTPDDVDMKDFSIARDLGPNGLITYIKRARQYGKFVLQAPMDYPPDWMLYVYQDVDPHYYDALAKYYLHYLKDYESNGVFIDYLSLFNEPGIYTKIPYTEINRLLRDHVGPLLKKEHVRTQIMMSEAPTRENAARNYPLVLDDPASRKFVSILPYHGYDLKNFEDIAALHKKYPQYHLWMTELCHVSMPVYEFADGDFWGNQIFDDLEASTSAWIYWNMVLDEQGGPWSVSLPHGNPDPNNQHPVVIVDRKTKKVTYTGLYYYLAHFSKFVRPGAVRIQTLGKTPGVRVMSFAAPDEGIVAEIMNSNKSAAEIDLAFHGQMVHLSLPALSITTATWQKSPAKQKVARIAGSEDQPTGL